MGLKPFILHYLLTCIDYVPRNSMVLLCPQLELHVEQVARRTQKVLVLLHRQDGPPPKGTVRWLNARSYCHAHHHIKAPHRMFHARHSHSKIVSGRCFDPYNPSL